MLRHPVNAGMYVFAPGALEHVEHGRPLAMVDFLNDVLIPRRALRSFPVVEYWNDVGTHQAFEAAERDLARL